MTFKWETLIFVSVDPQASYGQHGPMLPEKYALLKDMLISFSI